MIISTFQSPETLKIHDCKQHNVLYFNSNDYKNNIIIIDIIISSSGGVKLAQDASWSCNRKILPLGKCPKLAINNDYLLVAVYCKNRTRLRSLIP